MLALLIFVAVLLAVGIFLAALPTRVDYNSYIREMKLNLPRRDKSHSRFVA
jgi:hypothetical protein